MFVTFSTELTNVTVFATIPITMKPIASYSILIQIYYPDRQFLVHSSKLYSKTQYQTYWPRHSTRSSVLHQDQDWLHYHPKINNQHSKSHPIWIVRLSHPHINHCQTHRQSQTSWSLVTVALQLQTRMICWMHFMVVHNNVTHSQTWHGSKCPHKSKIKSWKCIDVYFRFLLCKVDIAFSKKNNWTMVKIVSTNWFQL